MPHEVRLIRQSYFNITIYHDTLAAQSRGNSRVNRPVDKIFFLVRYFLHVVHAFVYIDVARAATAYAAAIVLQFDAIFEANIQYRLTFGDRQFYCFMPGFLEVYFNLKNIHFGKSNKIT